MRIPKFLFFILSLILGLSLRTPDSAFAHGTHFHSLEELAGHIENHIAGLESALSGKTLDPAFVRLKSREIIEHGRQYQEALQRLARKGSPSGAEAVKIFERMTARLVRAGHSRDLVQGLNTLRRMKTFLASSGS